jgi:hypothetical protein
LTKPKNTNQYQQAPTGTSPSSPTGEKVLPRNVEAEEAVLASMMVDAAADDTSQIETLAQFLKAEHFSRGHNGWIWETMVSLYNRGKPTDQITVSQDLGARDLLDKVGGPGYLSLLIQRLPTSVHAVHYGKIVRNMSIYRDLIQAGTDIANVGHNANGESPEAALAAAQTILEAVGAELGSQPLVITHLKKKGREAPMYYLDVNGQTIKVPPEDFLSYKRFREKVCQLCNFVPPKMKEEDWMIKINRLLKTLEIDAGPMETSPDHHIWMGARNLLSELMPVETLEEFQTGKPLAKGDCLFIKGVPFFNAVKQKIKQANLQPNTFFSILKDHGAKDTTTRIGGKIEGCWRVPLAILEEKVEETDDRDYLL